jgi:hypothetical protein
MFISNRDATREPVGFSSMFVYDQKSVTIAAGYISFYSMAPNCRFPQDPLVKFTIDGETVNFTHGPEAEKRGEGTATSFSEVEGGKCNESLNVIIPQPTYLRIANAKRVDVQVGKLGFSLEENQQKALRELGRMMAAPRL